MNNRYALGLRLDPLIMASDGEDPRETPYGVIFSHGRRFDGYHVRFRDIARGGMRLVTPTSPEQFALESAHQYDECYGLAYAQQLKNKDIPEGGSKAVVLIDTVGMSTSGRDFVMRKSVKAFVDTILDLVVDTPETREEIVDFVGKKEVLYLGPDEQVCCCLLSLLLLASSNLVKLTCFYTLLCRSFHKILTGLSKEQHNVDMIPPLLLCLASLGQVSTTRNME